ncbi:MAG: hypothetical protein EOM92_15370 [Gammaproteobacteria bacterium]|jgi:clan AA aspartic protease (TIGR02281 family)|nr:hypothetical protein [Gammaproteobacteria bacterium]
MKPSSPGIWRLHGWVLALPLLSVLSPGWLAAQAPPGELPPASNRNPPPVRPQPTTATGAQTPQPTTTAGVQTRVPVGEELKRLSAAHGFTLVGAGAIAEEARGRASGEELYPRLRKLLVDFDHIIVQKPDGGVERVIILGEKAAYVPPPTPTPAGGAPASGHIELKTTRRGTQHAVQISLEGAGGKRMTRELLVDTGADFVVLPASLLSQLGIDGEGLRPSEMQTANGKVQARIASLPAVWLGQSRIENVRAAFLEDQMLGNSGLLGMSVLSRFTLTIDDKGNRLTLDAKGGGQGGAPAGAGPVAPPPGGEGQTSAGQGAEPAPEMAAPPLPGEAQPPVLPEGMQ